MDIQGIPDSFSGIFDGPFTVAVVKVVLAVVVLMLEVLPANFWRDRCPQLWKGTKLTRRSFHF